MIYLDNAATSFPKAPGVAAAVSRQILETGGNPGRASHRMARDASRLLFDAREELAAFVGLRDPRRLCFTQNATEALNAAILGFLEPGALVATSSLEHNAVMRPLRHLQAVAGIRLIVFPCDGRGRPEPSALREAIAAKPDLLVCSMASNVTGAFLPVDEIGELCVRAGVPFGLDGSQAVGHRLVDFDTSKAAFLCFPGHKGLLGPTGTGALCLAQGFEPEPLFRGGTGSQSDSECQPDFPPDRHESGTRNLAGISGLLASIRFIEKVGIRAIEAVESAVTGRLSDGLARLQGIRLFGPEPGEPRSPLVSFTIEGWTVSDLAMELDRRDIACRMGFHCAPAAHRSIGTFESGGTVRLSPGFFTTGAEIDETIAALSEILR